MEPTRNTLTIPVAIVAAALIIGGAIFFSNGAPQGNGAPAGTEEAALINAPTGTTINLPPVTADDHLLGNPSAPIVLVEYSDTECPFCKRFHETMHSLLESYGKNGTLAWVYRHFPLDSLHPKAPKEAAATECAAEQGGNTGFWNYLDRIFAVTPSNNGLDEVKLPSIAKDVGLDAALFAECLESGRQADRVGAEYKDAITAGGTGTPYSILILANPLTPAAKKRLGEINEKLKVGSPFGSPDPIGIDVAGRKVSIGGAFQLPLMKEILDLLLSGK